jgi:hypothetical protein
MIMVFKVRTLLAILRRLYPATHERFSRIYDDIGTPAEINTIDDVYRTLEPINFSKGFLELVAATSPGIISILPVLQVFWSDWGSPERLLQVREVLSASAGEATQRNSAFSPSRRKPKTEQPLAQQPQFA